MQRSSNKHQARVNGTTRPSRIIHVPWHGFRPVLVFCKRKRYILATRSFLATPSPHPEHPLDSAFSRTPAPTTRNQPLGGAFREALAVPALGLDRNEAQVARARRRAGACGECASACGVEFPGSEKFFFCFVFGMFRGERVIEVSLSNFYIFRIVYVSEDLVASWLRFQCLDLLDASQLQEVLKDGDLVVGRCLGNATNGRGKGAESRNFFSPPHSGFS